MARRRKRNQFAIFQVIGGVLILGLALGGLAWLLLSRDTALRDEATLCSEEGAPRTLIILVDNSGPMSGLQAAQVRLLLSERMMSVARETLIVLSAVQSGDGIADHLSRCRPIHQSEASQVTQNPRMIAEQFERNFRAPLLEQLDAVLASAVAASGLESFSETSARSELQARRMSGNELVLTLGERVSFESGSDQPVSLGVEVISELGRALATRRGYAIHVIGHTDTVGAPSENIDLSTRRAEAVRKLLTQAGVSTTAISARGVGDQDPVASNATSVGRSRNRRVEIILVPIRPVAETLQKTLVQARTHATPDAEMKAIVVTDMFQNSDTFSLYRGDRWNDFMASSASRRLGTGLEGVDVAFVIIRRDEPAIRDLDSVRDFWRSYVNHQGGRITDQAFIGDF